MSEYFKPALKAFPTQVGVYRMYDAHGKMLYVGKARNLRKRITQYYQRRLDTKTQVLMAQVGDIQTTVTSDETEAFLLEANLIKEFKPRYNILLRDDKSYPYLYLNTHETFPRLDFYRGAKKAQGQYFGPFPDAGSVRENLALVQKLFKLRQCTDHFFKSRLKPCLQYQIKRCTAPCVGYVDANSYRQQVEEALLFLEGKNEEVINRFRDKMEEASTRQDYETAAAYRDHVAKLRHLQKQQFIVQDQGDIDVVGVSAHLGYVGFEILFVRRGRLIGQKAFFPRMPKDTSIDEALTAFLAQYYLSDLRKDNWPARVLLGEKLKERIWVERALSQKLNQTFRISDQKRLPYKRWQQLANANAKHALLQHLSSQNTVRMQLDALQFACHLPNPIFRLECFDVSHTMGKETVAACVVFAESGFIKSAYRRFNITDVTPGDDYGALSQAVVRRYARLKSGGGDLPDVIVIDGGKGQLRCLATVFEELQISGVVLLAVAKGLGRKRGLETIYRWENARAVRLEAMAEHHPVAMQLLQLVRDEAHRFSVLGHRAKRQKRQITSPLQNIPGIGPGRRRALLRHFGGLQELRKANVDEISKVSGISEKLAQQLYDILHQ